MTQLFVVRHAIAADKTSEGSDAARPLTEKGRRRWREAVKGAKRLGFRFDRLLHSPWLRAVDTAQELSVLVEGRTQVTELLAQAPTDSLMALFEGDRIAVVGHQPWLGELVGLLAFGRPEAGEGIELKRGSMLCLEGTPKPGGMVITASLPPRVLRALGG
jgi:phosphohistidine phosphatase